MKKVNILGVEYEILYKTSDEKEALKNCSGYCDTTSKKIYVAVPTEKEKEDPNFIENVETFQATVIRHEVIHAFLYESGLAHDSARLDSPWAVNEEMVDWVAIQFPKIQKVYEELGV